jgi:type IV secretion system protein VirB5
LSARREWLERYGDYLQSAHQWRLVAFGSLVVTAIAVAGMVYSAAQNHYIPYVVQVDRLGVAARRSRRRGNASRYAHRACAACTLISDVRSVYVDAAAQRSVIDEGYAMISRTGSSFKALTDYFRENSPFERAEKETVTVEVHTVLPVAGNTWRVEWSETTRGRNGEVQKVDEWQSSITVLISPPSDEVTILKNPLGIYIVEYSWTKRA